MGGDATICSQLIGAGADVNAQRKYGKTALIITAYHGHATVCSALIEAGADVHAQNKWGQTALDVAIRWTSTAWWTDQVRVTNETKETPILD